MLIESVDLVAKKRRISTEEITERDLSILALEGLP